MRILHVAQRWREVGGVETYTMELVGLLGRSGHGNLVAVAEAGDVPAAADGVVAAPAPGPDLDDLVAEYRPDVAYLHDVYDPDLAAAVVERLPAVAYVHIFYPVCPGLAKLYRRGETICERAYGLGCVPSIYLRRCASARAPWNVYRIMAQTRRHLSVLARVPRVLVASRYMADLLVQNGLEGERVTRLPYFVPIPPSVAGPRAGGDLLFVGRFEPEKGLERLLEALARMRSQRRLTVVGAGSHEDACRRAAERLGLAGRVLFRGWLSTAEVAAAYEEAAIVVMPTLMPEPFGKVGVEAMAHGRPVVAFGVGGIPDWLRHGDNGLLVAAGDVDGLARSLDELIDDPQRARELGRNGRGLAVERYGADAHLASLVSVLEAAARGGSGA